MGRVPRKGVTVCLFSILVVERSEFLCASEPGSLLRTQQGDPNLITLILPLLGA